MKVSLATVDDCVLLSALANEQAGVSLSSPAPFRKPTTSILVEKVSPVGSVASDTGHGR